MVAYFTFSNEHYGSALVSLRVAGSPAYLLNVSQICNVAHALTMLLRTSRFCKCHHPGLLALLAISNHQWLGYSFTGATVLLMWI